MPFGREKRGRRGGVRRRKRKRKKGARFVAQMA